MTRGKMKYIPACLVEELHDIKSERRINRDAEAFEKIAQYSQVGREAERLAKFNFKWRPRRKR